MANLASQFYKFNFIVIAQRIAAILFLVSESHKVILVDVFRLGVSFSVWTQNSENPPKRKYSPFYHSAACVCLKW